MRVVEEPPSAEVPSEPAREPGPVSPIGMVTVPPWQEGLEAAALPRSYQDLLEVAANAGRPQRPPPAAAGLAGRGARGLFSLSSREGAGETPEPGR